MRRGNCKVIHGFLLVPSVLVAQSWQLCNPMDCSLPGSSVHGIVQARVLEWVAILFSRGSSQPSNWTWLSLIAGRFFTIWATNSRASCNHFQDRQKKLVISAICSDASGVLKLRTSELKDSGFTRHILWLCPPQGYHGEGNGTPLQYSCLENPMDGGAW